MLCVFSFPFLRFIDSMIEVSRAQPPNDKPNSSVARSFAVCGYRTRLLRGMEKDETRSIFSCKEIYLSSGNFAFGDKNIWGLLLRARTASVFFYFALVRRIRFFLLLLLALLFPCPSSACCLFVLREDAPESWSMGQWL